MQGKDETQEEQPKRDVRSRSHTDRPGADIPDRLLDFAAGVGEVMGDFRDPRLARYVANQLVIRI
jgi:hypothetical protein